jgi:GNAT superfamily N-acetyltransferase
MTAAGGVTVRRARPEDIPSLIAFNTRLARETEGMSLDKARLENGLRAVVGSPHRGFYLVAELDGRVVGCVLITYEWSDWRNGWFWWIQSVYVVAGARRRGVFSALYRAVRSQARRCGDVCGLRLYMCRDNAAARQVYTRLGMKPSRYEVLQAPLRPRQKRKSRR